MRNTAQKQHKNYAKKINKYKIVQKPQCRETQAMS